MSSQILIKFSKKVLANTVWDGIIHLNAGMGYSWISSGEKLIASDYMRVRVLHAEVRPEIS